MLPLAACDPPEELDREPAPVPRRAWSPDDDPSLLAPDFEYRLDALPTAGSAERLPWPGPYWPSYHDSINYRWAGQATLSPAEKYAQAFARFGVEDAVSQFFGVDSVLGGKSCLGDIDCDMDRGFLCGKRRGQKSGTCVEAWFGLCDAWAAASILEPEPAAPVAYGGINFRVNDLKALISLAYSDDLKVRFVSLRCNDKGVDGEDNPECDDTNAGTFHVVVANLLGVRREAFIQDRTYDYEVWNQPVFAFKVTHLLPLTGQQANQVLGGGALVHTDVAQGQVPSGKLTPIGQVPVAPGQTVRVRTSGTGDIDLYVRWNADPTPSQFDCRPFFLGSDEQCELLAPEGATAAHVAVQAFGGPASYQAAFEVRDVAPPTYLHNPKAKSLRFVRTELSWVSESPETVDGPLSGSSKYSRTDILDYVLELDGHGKIIGGEWVGVSKLLHPDFLWRPLEKLPGTVVGGRVSWADVQKLLAGD